MLRNIINGLIQLAYPQICSGCGAVLMRQEKYFCLQCVHNMPFTAISSVYNNEIMRRLSARVPLSWGYGLMYFQKKSITQRTLHDIKYNNHKDLAVYMGGMLAKHMEGKINLDNNYIIIPVPLHVRKERLRGYNQSAFLGKGMSEQLGIPCCNNILLRKNFRDSQTHKHRSERWEQIQKDFFIRDNKEVYNKNVILVDDIFTTGATAEVCSNTLLNAQVKSVAVVTLAIAVN